MGEPLIYSLPNEQLLEIGNWVHPQHDPRALVLTNKLFHALFEPKLYKSDTAEEALHWAVKKHSLTVASKVIEYGGDVDVEKDATTPLISASLNSDLAMIKILIKTGADVNKSV